MYNTSTKTITTKRLILRPFTLSDSSDLATLCNNINLSKSMISLPYPYTNDHAVSWISTHEENFDNNTYYSFAITDKTTGTLYGSVGISHKIANKHGEIGYWIGEPYWGNNYATEACEAVLAFAFVHKGYNKVFGIYFSSNTASGTIMKKIGMVQEGTLKEHILKNNKYEDVVQYGITRSLYLADR